MLGDVRVLKEGETFAVLDPTGDIHPAPGGSEGLYHEGTRFLSRLELTLDGKRPVLLDASIRPDSGGLNAHLTNPEAGHEATSPRPRGTLHLRREVFLYSGSAYESVTLTNHDRLATKVTLAWRTAADFADVFEARGFRRTARGRILPPHVDGQTLDFGYEGLDGVTRRTRLAFGSPPEGLDAHGARYALTLDPGETITLHLTITCAIDDPPGTVLTFDHARARADTALREAVAASAAIRSSSPAFDAWLDRSWADLRMLTTRTPHGPYPYAGVPWFSTPFGRDGILTAFETLWLAPSLTQGVLAFLAATQATGTDPSREAEPGKILHEARGGELAALGEIPYGRYYGTVDATPLFVLLAGAYLERTTDTAFLRGIWPALRRALAWVDAREETDGGFLAYARHGANGLVNQGWKDSGDAVFHANGGDAPPPIALCEVQGYVYAARLAAAAIALALDHADEAAALRTRAEALRRRFDAAFWCEEIGTYALALDGERHPCRVRTSNAGHCLWTGIASAAHARTVAETLLAPASFSGWGVRTLAAGEARYNPMAYHNGSVWPHDSALVAAGLARHGRTEGAQRILSALFDAACAVPLHRLPELYCGFDRRAGEGPVPYPSACAPQAWAAGAVFLLLQASLGLRIDARRPAVHLHRPRLPAFLQEVRIERLQVGAAEVDLLLVRREEGVDVTVTRGEGVDVEV